MDEHKNDIEKYLSGKMTSAERQALEKKALSDPFLSDALEGAETMSGHLFSLDVNELNQKISNQKNNNKWLWPLRIAASVVGIAVVSSVIFLSLKDNSTNHLADNKKGKEEKGSTASNKNDSLFNAQGKKESSGESLAVIGEEKKAEPLIAENKVEKGNEQPKKDKVEGALIEVASGISTSTAITEENKGNSPEPVADSILQGRTAVSTQETELSGFFNKTTNADDVQEAKSARAAGELSRAKKMQSSKLVVKGQVRDQQGQPLPGVNITPKGSAQGTTTDADGNYSIVLSEPNQTLVYSFIGFVAQEQAIEKDKAADINVQLQEDAFQLSEVVVTGYGAQRSNDEPVVRLAEPDGGRKAYDQYLEDKKLYPTQAFENKIEGKVVIEFTITTTGLLTDFNVVRTIGYGCDEEVIRLVKEGPKWQPTYIDNEAVESLVRVKTKFELKKKK
jgi:TonB family protein